MFLSWWGLPKTSCIHICPQGQLVHFPGSLWAA